MLKTNKDDSMINVINNSANTKIHLRESDKLMELKEKCSSQLRIELNDLCYSVYRNGEANYTLRKMLTGIMLKSKRANKMQKCGNKKTILRDITGRFEPGKITVIIGPSGAGKTSLLKIVSGERLLNVKGTITINGIVQSKRTAFRKQMCYVPQHFSLLPFLTIKETLYIAIQLKLKVKQSKQTIYLIVNEITNNLGLSDCQNTLVHKLSGGEQKRLSIGTEIITNPSVLLLDEPTSGLDSAASNQLINILHTMAKANCTVVCAIHQPSSQMISQFDDIMVLDRGRSMYCGPNSKILNTFEKAGFTCPPFYNIAEFVLEVITEQRGGDLENLYKVSRNEYENFRSQKNSSISSECNYDDDTTFTNNKKQRLSMWQQQKILFVRALICMKRDLMMTILRLSAHIIIALLLGAVFYDFGNDAQKVHSNIACLFFLMIFLFFANSMPAIQMFPTEAAVFLQEHVNNWYSLKSYYSVKILTDLLMQVFCSSSFLLISYYVTGQPMEVDRVLQAWSVCVLITIIGQTAGILIGVVCNTKIGIFLIQAVSIPLLLFAGFFVKIKEVPTYLQPLGYVSFFRYTFEGLLQAVYIDRPNLPCQEIYCHLKSPSTILSVMNMPTVSFHVILIILGSWIFCLHAVTYAVLCWKIYYARK